MTLRVVPNSTYPAWETELQKIVDELRLAATGRIDYGLELVDAIPHDGGKIRFIVYE